MPRFILDTSSATILDTFPGFSLRKIGEVIAEARILLNDPTPSGTGSTFSGTATTRTVGGVITQARGFLNDIDATNYRYPDADLYIYFGDALLMLRRYRPDLFETGTNGVMPSYRPTDGSTPFPVDETYIPAFVQYVVSAAEMRDDTTAQEQKATALAQGFMANLTGSPYRYAESFLYQIFTDAMGDARGVRPDLFHGQMRVPAPTYSTADAGDAFPIDDRYFSTVVDYVVGRARWRNRETGSGETRPPPDYLAIFQQRMRA